MSEITVLHVEPLFPFEAYTHVVEPLSDQDGGGYLITFPDCPVACPMEKRLRKR